MLSLPVKVELEQGKVVRIIGPASLFVERGCIRILGANYGQGSRVVVNRFRSYAVKAIEPTTLSVVLGEGGSIEEPAPGEEVVEEWERITDEILSRGSTTTVVIGPVDSGKTSFSAMLANKALEKGLSVAIVDADVGQGDLAPPAFISMAYIDRKILWLRELRGGALKFVGFISPTFGSAAQKLVASIACLVSRARADGKNVIVVNTDGWVYGWNAIELKLDIVRSVEATDVVVLDQSLGETFQRMLRGTNVRVHVAPRPQVVRERDRGDRRYLRKMNYQRFFQNAKVVCLPIDSIAILGSCLFSGRKLSDEELAKLSQELETKVLAGSELDDALVLYTVGEPKPAALQKVRDEYGREVYIIARGSESGVLAAVLDKSLSEVAPAIVKSLNFDTGQICILTEYSGEIGGIVVGRVRLSEDWEEVGKPVKCLL